MRDAYTLFDQVLSFSEEKITLAGIRDKMGLVGLESTSELLNAAAEGNRRRALEILDDILGSGTAVEQVLLELADFLRNLTLMAYGIEKESLLGLSPDRFPEGPRKAWNTSRLETAAEDAFTLYRDIRYSLNPRYEIELFVGRLCSLNDRLSSSDVLERITSLRNELLGGWTSPAEGSLHSTDGILDRSGKKKIPESVRSAPENSPTAEQEAEEFFSIFKNSQKSEVPAEEPSCALPDIGVNLPPPETMPPETTSDIPVNPEEKKELLIAEIRRGNLSLAAALEKARRWEWTEHSLLLIFDSSYEEAVVKNESETLRQAGKSAEMLPFSVETRTEAPSEEREQSSESPRAALIRQVFRGQIVKG